MMLEITQVIAAIALAAPPPQGHFMAITNVPGFQRLYKVHMNGTAVPVGEVGQLSPTPATLTWEPKSQRLIASRYPDEDGHFQWVEIDRQSGNVWPLSFSRFPATQQEVGCQHQGYGLAQECAADPNTGKLYCRVNCSGIVRVDVDTGVHSLVRQANDIQRLTWVDGFLGNVTGFVGVGSQNALVRIDPATWQATTIGGYPETSCDASFWMQDTLYCLKQTTSRWPCGFNSEGGLIQFDEKIGSEELVQCVPLNQHAQYLRFAYIPEPMDQPEFCDTLIDSDYDEDVDLRDFARFQNCMTDPRPKQDE